MKRIKIPLENKLGQKFRYASIRRRILVNPAQVTAAALAGFFELSVSDKEFDALESMAAGLGMTIEQYLVRLLKNDLENP